MRPARRLRLRRRRPPADPRHGDAGFVQPDEAHAIENGERLRLRAVGGNLHGAVGEHTVDIHGEEADRRPATRSYLRFPIGDCGFLCEILYAG